MKEESTTQTDEREQKWAETLDLDIRRAHDRMVLDDVLAMVDSEMAAVTDRAEKAERELRMRELHHFETEQVIARVKDVLKFPRVARTIGSTSQTGEYITYVSVDDLRWALEGPTDAEFESATSDGGES